MPELPEVETIVRDLKSVLPGAKMKAVKAHVPSMLKVSEVISQSDFFDKEVLEVSRRGKFIIIHFEDNLFMTIHLRMTGRIIVMKYEDDQLDYERVRIDFSDDKSLRFCDVRKFGKVWLSSKKELDDFTGMVKLGIEPFSSNFNEGFFRNLLKGRKTNVKSFLLNQSLIAGIGNIYADESCFYSKIRPDRSVADLDENEISLLYKSVIRALEQGIRNRGTSVSNYQDAYGKTGKNQELLYVYGRGNKPCMNCKTLLTKTRTAGRGTVYCENCQK